MKFSHFVNFIDRFDTEVDSGFSKVDTFKFNADIFLFYLKLQKQTNVFMKHKCPNNSNFKDGHGHKDKYLDTCTKILSQEMLMCNYMKASINYFVMIIVILNMSNVKVKRFSNN